MPLPSRPVSITTIDSEWGQAVHDWTFAPAGCHVRNSGTVTKNSTPGILPLTEAVDDPGGWLDAANNQVIVPADKGGLYLCLLYTSDAADERSSVDLGGRRIIK